MMYETGTLSILQDRQFILLLTSQTKLARRRAARTAAARLRPSRDQRNVVVSFC